jgi:hypothetical protein
LLLQLPLNNVWQVPQQLAHYHVACHLTNSFSFYFLYFQKIIEVSDILQNLLEDFEYVVV